jgi:hypothetical protein
VESLAEVRLASMPLTPADFRSDVTEAEIQRMRRQEREARAHYAPVEFTLSGKGDPCLAEGEEIRLELPREQLAGTFVVLDARRVRDGTRYKLLRTGAARTRPKLVRLIR